MQSGTQVEVEKVNTGTLTLGAGSVLTITAIPGGPQAQGTIKAITAVANTPADNQETAVASAEPARRLAETSILSSILSPVAEDGEVASVLSVGGDDLHADAITSLDAAAAPSPVVDDQYPPAANVDTAAETAPQILNSLCQKRPR